jgi:hypothetical protein
MGRNNIIFNLLILIGFLLFLWLLVIHHPPPNGRNLVEISKMILIISKFLIQKQVLKTPDHLVAHY